MQNYVFADGNSIQNFCLGLVSMTNLNGMPACPVVVDNKDAPSVALAKCCTCGDLTPPSATIRTETIPEFSSVVIQDNSRPAKRIIP